jgi:hypothetical protein
VVNIGILAKGKYLQRSPKILNPYRNESIFLEVVEKGLLVGTKGSLSRRKQ